MRTAGTGGTGWLLLALIALAAGAWLLLGTSPERAVDDARQGETGSGAPPPTLRPGAPPESVPPGEAGSAETSAATRTATLRGTVVLPSGAPAPGARVRVAAGAEPVLGRTDEQGRFDLEAPMAPEEAVFVTAQAHDASGRAGFACIWLWHREAATLPPVVLGAASEVVVRVVGSGGPVAGARAALVVQGAGRAGSFGERTCDERGEARFEAVPHGALLVLGTANGFGRASKALRLPRAVKGPVVVALVPEVPLTVRVIERGSGVPVPGARLGLRTFQPYGYGRLPAVLLPSPEPTDEQGRSVLHGLSADLRAEARVESTGHLASRWRRLPAGGDEHTIELQPFETLVWALRDAGDGIPPDGSVIRLAPYVFRETQRMLPEGRIENGTLVVRAARDGFFSALATAPDGTVARLLASPGDTPSPVAFHRPATVEVRLRRPDGTPAAGLWVKAHRGTQRVYGVLVQTDEEGEATLAVPADVAEVSVVLVDDPADGAWAAGDTVLGSRFVENGHAVIEATVPWRREVVLRVTTGGVRRLPATYALRTDRRAVEPSGEDRRAAEVRFLWRPPEAPVSLHVTAPGYAPVRVALPRDLVPDPLVLDVSLEAAGTLLVRVAHPRDRSLGLQALRLDERSGRWDLPPEDADQRGQPTVQGPYLDGSYRIEGLGPGRYRVVDAYSNAGSDEVELGSEQTVELSLDLSRAGEAKGRVRVPEGHDVTQAVVVLTGGVPSGWHDSWGLRSVQVGKDGSFRIRVPGNRPVLLRAVHPELVDDPARAVRVVEPRDGIELVLEGGALAGIRLEPWPDRLRRWSSPVRVLLFRGPVEGEPVSEQTATPHEPEIRFGGFEPGRYTVWVDFGGPCWGFQQDHVPLVLPDVTLGAGTTALGPVAPESGGSVRVRLVLDDPESQRSVRIRAQHRGSPAYARQVFSYWKGSEPVVVTGLGRGRFELVVEVDGHERARRDVESDGSGTTEVSVDLRRR